MTILTEEIPFTNEALKIYISGVTKRIEFLNPFVNEERRLTFRLKKAIKRLEDHGIKL